MHTAGIPQLDGFLSAGLLPDVRRELARRSLLHFTTYTFPGYQVNWHHRVLAEMLDGFVSGHYPRLMVFMPPRHGKSELVSRRLPAYILGRRPDAQIIACSYASDLAARMNRDVQRIIEHPHYHEVFPESTLAATSSRAQAVRNTEMFELLGQHGVYRSAGVGGGITGMGMNFGIIDDPIKNREEAQSSTIRNNLWDWYTSTFFTRLEKHGRILLTMTRWHYDDLAGRLLAANVEAPERERWTILSFPARAEVPTDERDPRQAGEPLWPWKYSDDTLQGIQQTIGPQQWAALYQQRPAPTEGALFVVETLRDVEVLPDAYRLLAPDHEPRTVAASKCRVFLTVDLAASLKESADWTVVSAWAVTPQQDLLWLDVYRVRMEGPDHVDLIERVAKKYRPCAIGIESVAYQLALVQSVRRTGLPVREIRVDRDKVSRAIPAAARMSAGAVYARAGASWRSALADELLRFPYGEHDDQVDTLSMAVELAPSLGMTVPKTLGVRPSYWKGMSA